MQISQLSMLPAAERHRLIVEWNATTRTVPAKPLSVLFEEQVTRTPNATAVVQGEYELTYAELNRRANQLAQRLRMLDVVGGTKVATLLDRSIELVIAEIAILKCGATYVPLDPAYPIDRLRYLLTDSGAIILICNDEKFLEEVPVIVVNLALPCTAISEVDNTVTSVPIDSQGVAYVMYTSGSTGQPKGVLVRHCGVIRLVLNNGYAQFEPTDRVAFASNPAFDLTTFEVWAPLLTGGRIVVVDQETLLTPLAFKELLRRQRVTVLWLTVGLFNQYADELMLGFAHLRYLIVGGDALDPQVVRRVLSDGRPEHLLNGYGPTEATTFATTHEIVHVPEDARSVPIGRPIGNTQVYILDVNGEPVPIGVIGELYIGGMGVALGYLNRPELTDERFVTDIFSSDPGARMFKTGDLGRWLPDGTIDFVGRNDNQVKLRGFRVELGEIESALLQYPGVKRAVVVVREDTFGEKVLVAYYTIAGDEVNAEMLRSHLASNLPEYMIPAAFLQLESWPLTPSGKLDRNALPEPDATAYVRSNYEAPNGEIETALACIWSDILKIHRISRHDNFFELGGHSLLIVRVITSIRQVLSLEIAVRDLYVHPVLKDLAQVLRLNHRPKPGLVDLRHELILDETISPTSTAAKPGPPRSILLTGASGFLGAFLLSSLLRKTSAHIYCLVRCNTEQQGGQKVRNSLEQFELVGEYDSNRITVIQGDLELNLFGLSEHEFEKLATSIDLIYHNGAWVNALHDYKRLKPANVLGTQEVIRLAATARNKHINYISTLSAGVEYRFMDRHGLTGQERLALEWDALANGYERSKWVAERLLDAANERGISSTIYRPTHISGSMVTGASSSDDIWSRFIDACIRLRSYPDIDLRVNLLPVDFVSDTIVNISMKKESQSRVYDLVNPINTNLRDLYKCMLTIDSDMRAVPYDAWLTKCSEDPSTEALTSILESAYASNSGDSDVGKVADIRQSLPQGSSPVITEDILRKYIFWRQVAIANSERLN